MRTTFMEKSQMDAFDRGAVYYEALANNAKRLEKEGPFLLAQLEQAHGKRVLDLACGTGLHALFFAEHGAEATGCDLSPGMIAYARAKRPHPKIRYRVADMRAPEGGPYDLVVCLGNSLCLVTEPADLAAVFHGVAACLAPGGRFVTQTLNYNAPAAQQPRHRIERATLEDGELVVVKNLVPHGDRTLLNLGYFAVRTGGVDAVAETAVLRNWTMDELAAAAQCVGLSVMETLGGYNGQPYVPEVSTDIVVIAIK
jgi:SAM-dependent methyltransferase